MKTVAVLLTVHNRKDKTLACLERLFAQKAVETLQMDVYLVDDGCTDGTSKAVRKQFPRVNIIQGDGQLFWNRGMHLAWETAAKVQDYDFYLWLNDDTLLFPDAMACIFSAAEQTAFFSIICGPTCAPKSCKVTYSGYKKVDHKLLKPDGTIHECDMINGNFVLIPKVIYKAIGNLDLHFPHAIGDFDYALRAQEAGFKNYIAPNFIGICELHPRQPTWCLKETPLIERFKSLYYPLGYAQPIPFFIYEKRHFGWGVAIKHFFSIHLRALFPQLWKK